MKRRAAALGLFGALGAVAAAGHHIATRREPPAAVLPDAWLRLPELQRPAHEFDLATWRGRPFLLHAWASWCGPCRREHAGLRQLAALARARGLALVGVAVRDDPRAAQEWLRAQGDPAAQQLLDAQGLVLARWQLAGLPATLLVDGAGRVRHRHEGVLTPAAWEAAFVPRLAGTGVPAG